MLDVFQLDLYLPELLRRVVIEGAPTDNAFFVNKTVCSLFKPFYETPFARVAAVVIHTVFVTYHNQARSNKLICYTRVSLVVFMGDVSL